MRAISKNSYFYNTSLFNKTTGLNMIQNMNQKSSSDIFSLAGQYKTLQTHGYRSLVKSYYNQNKKTEETNKTNTVNNSIDYTKIKDEAASLVNASSKLYTTGSSSLFKTDKNGVIDSEKAYSAVSEFVSSYNTVIQESSSTTNKAINNMNQSIKNTSKAYEASLKKIGITMDENGKMSLNKDAFLAASSSDIKSLMNGTSSYAYQIGSQAMALSTTSSLQAVYNQSGAFKYMSGDIYSQYM